MKMLRFEITITMAETAELSEDELAGLLSDSVGQFADAEPMIEDFDIIRLADAPSVTDAITLLR